MCRNDKLKDLYYEKYPLLYKKIHEENIKLDKLGNYKNKATNPLLLKTNDLYDSSDIKIMFFGQETNIWLREKNKGAFLGDIEPLIALYDDFYLKKKCYNYGGQFWNGIKRFEKIIQKSFPNKNIGLLWNNLVKIGKCSKGFPYKINHITNEYFNVIKEEIDILEPDFLVFFTGPNYDITLRSNLVDFKVISINGYKSKEICGINFSYLPKAIRTYHPNYLWRTKRIDDYLTEIVNYIKLNI